jgi:DNA-directed RNA polymerase specialized sigma24 family protein
MSTPSSGRPAHEGWLILPEVTRAIDGALRRKGVRGADLDDHRQMVLERALVAPPPGSLGECVVMVRTIASHLVIDTFRQKKSRSKVDAGPYETPDDRPANDPGDAADRIDERRQLAFVRGEIEGGNLSAQQAAILTSAADDVPQSEIAADLNLAHSTVRNELAAARRAVRVKWAAFTAVTLAFFGFVFTLTRPPPPVGSAPPSDSAPPRTPLEAADRMRRHGLDECDREHWAACLELLDDAKVIDPPGDQDEHIQRVRAVATRELDGLAHPKGAPPAPSGSTPP